MTSHELPADGENFTYAHIVHELHNAHRECVCPRRAALALLGDHLIHTNTWAGQITRDILTTAAGMPVDPQWVDEEECSDVNMQYNAD